MSEVKVGKITHYFGHINVAAVQITEGELRVGDTIHIVGHTSNFTQPVESMQIEHQSVQGAAKGQTIGLRVAQHARDNDEVFKVLPEQGAVPSGFTAEDAE